LDDDDPCTSAPSPLKLTKPSEFIGNYILKPFIGKKSLYTNSEIPIRFAATRQAVIPLIQTTTHSAANRSSSRLLEIHVKL
jgi:hypothetical protein